MSLTHVFESAAKELRDALANDSKGLEEAADANSPNEALRQFFSTLDATELFLQSNHTILPQIYVVEGLDGSGKTSLARHLAMNYQTHTTQPYRTPPISLSSVRAVFDKYKGPSSVSRAFYMVRIDFLSSSFVLHRSHINVI